MGCSPTDQSCYDKSNSDNFAKELSGSTNNCIYAPGDWVGEGRHFASLCNEWCTIPNIRWKIEDFSGDATSLVLTRMAYAKVDCGHCTMSGEEVTWLGSCSGGQINANGFNKIMVNGNMTST